MAQEVEVELTYRRITNLDLQVVTSKYGRILIGLSPVLLPKKVIYS